MWPYESYETPWKSSKRDDVVREIKLDEQEKDKLEHDISILHERLNKVVTNLARKVQIRDEYGKIEDIQKNRVIV